MICEEHSFSLGTKMLFFISPEQRNSTCIMAPEASSTAYSLVEALQMLGHKVQFLATGIEPPPSFTNAFNNVIFFHVHHTDMETPLLDFATLLDLDKQVMYGKTLILQP